MATETQFNIQNEMLNNFCRQSANAPTTDQLHNLLLQPGIGNEGLLELVFKELSSLYIS